MSGEPEPRAGLDPDHANPWITLETRTIYENPWIAVREDRVVRPDGQPGIYGVVHFKNKAVGVLPVDDDGHVWLVGQHRYPFDAYSWEIPEGGGPEGEDPEETALRELREETGLVAGRIESLGQAHLSNSVSDEVAYLFRATDLTPGESQPEGTERLQVRRFDWPTAWAMVQDGRITDSMSVIALLHEAVRRASGGQNPGRA
jgi:8-oxo-dGTP pyrophosphatase MutT (NUDIX family)